MANERFQYVDDGEVVSATIANGASLSDAVNLGGMLLARIDVPAEFDGTALTFQGSVDDVTFYNIYDKSGTELNYTVAASRDVRIDSIFDFWGLSSIKIRAGTAGAPSNQTGATVLKLSLKP